jgi:hypothetical protein
MLGVWPSQRLVPDREAGQLLLFGENRRAYQLNRVLDRIVDKYGDRSATNADLAASKSRD